MIYLYNRIKPDNKKLIQFPGKVFKLFYKSEWFDDEFAKGVFTEVEKCKYLGDDIFVSNMTGRKFIADNLSTGSKTLLFLKNTTEYCFMTGSLGDNCWKLLRDIQDEKDYHLILNWTPPYINKLGMKMFYVDAGERVYSCDDLIFKTVELDEQRGE